ncbi:MAG: hypothetical protein V4555_17555 [Acidobacteriota bacterium]
MPFSLKLLPALLLSGAVTFVAPGFAQSPAPTPSQQPAPEVAPAVSEPPVVESEPLPPPQGQVLFQSHAQPPATGSDEPAKPEAKPTGPELTDAERSSISITAYDLDARLTPASSGLAMRAGLTIRNDGKQPLSRIALQISSTLQWQSATLLSGNQPTPLVFAQHLLDTDADHTGKASEAILTLTTPLQPGETLRLDAFYSGTLAASTGRLERIGASSSQANAADWDAISPDATMLRGFGNVLWYPVAAPQLFLGDGAQLFQAIGQMRQRSAASTIHLYLAIEYKGEAPTAAYFCGRRQPLKAISDDADAPVASGSGVATAEFAAEPIGVRLPSLFIFAQPESLVAPLPSSGRNSDPAPTPASSSSSAQTTTATASLNPLTGDDPMLAVETTDDAVLKPLAASADKLAPLLEQWFGTHPLSALTVLDHDGQAFEDGPLLVAPAATLATSEESTALAHSLTHAWVQSGQPWMDEGLAQFVSLLWTEREKGRDAAIAQLNDLLQPLALTEPSFDSAAAAHATNAPAGQPLIAATDEVFYRRKAAAVWWMLSGIAGPDALRQALSAWRTQAVSHDSSEAQAIAFEKILERTSGKDLAWFFNDWVLHDRGLPDLAIVDVTPRQLPAGQGHNSGWLVAVTIRNNGAAEVEIPVIVRSGTFSVTHRLRIAGFASETERIVVEAAPTDVLVNDGSTPELHTSIHTRTLVARQE